MEQAQKDYKQKYYSVWPKIDFFLSHLGTVLVFAELLHAWNLDSLLSHYLSV